MPATCLPHWGETPTVSQCGEIGPPLGCPRPSCRQPSPATAHPDHRQKRTPIMIVDCVEGSVVSSRLGYCQACDCGRRVAAVEDVRCDGWKTCQVASHGLPELDVARVRRWCDERVPDAVRDQVRVECEVAPRYLTIVECRPPWREDMGTEWTRFPIARLRYSKQPQLGAVLARPQPSLPRIRPCGALIRCRGATAGDRARSDSDLLGVGLAPRARWRR